MTKKCFKCGEEKPIDEFYKLKTMADGHLNKCKECTRLDVSTNYRAKRHHYAHYEKQRWLRTERREKAKEYQRHTRANSPEKFKATCVVNNALRDGKLEKKPCEVCGSEKSQAHHDDYSKPLDVIWLCRKHHLERHGKETYEGLATP
jgi:hypothetical protein